MPLIIEQRCLIFNYLLQKEMKFLYYRLRFGYIWIDLVKVFFLIWMSIYL